MKGKPDKCDLCNIGTASLMNNIVLREATLYYIVENSKTDGYSRRISLVIKPHIVGIGILERVASMVLRKFVCNSLGISRENFFIKKTMRTYPEHFHIHACILPAKEGKEQVLTL